MFTVFAGLFFAIVASAEPIKPPPVIPICGSFGEPSGCASQCPVTCSNRFNPPVCNKECVDGCTCKPGYIIDDKSGLCVAPEDCKAPLINPFIVPPYESIPFEGLTFEGPPIEGPPFEVIPFEGLPVGGPPFVGPSFEVIPFEGLPFAGPPFEGPPFVLPSSCGLNGLDTQCASMCPLTCSNRFNPPECPPLCEVGCTCKPGHVIDDHTGLCVLPEDCKWPDIPFVPPFEFPPEIPKCVPFASWTECGSMCPMTCRNRFNPPICPDEYVERCRCNPGYIMDDDTGLCVPPSECKHHEILPIIVPIPEPPYHPHHHHHHHHQEHHYHHQKHHQPIYHHHHHQKYHHHKHHHQKHHHHKHHHQKHHHHEHHHEKHHHEKHHHEKHHYQKHHKKHHHEKHHKKHHHQKHHDDKK